MEVFRIELVCLRLSSSITWSHFRRSSGEKSRSSGNGFPQTPQSLLRRL